MYTFNLKTILFFAVCFSLLAFGTAVLGAQNPTANAGPDLYVASGQTITLQGSGYDSQSSSLNYYWNCSGGTLSSYSVAQPTYTAPNVGSYTQTTYNCSLTVTNYYGLSSSDSMTIYVNSNNQNSNYYVQTNSATNIYNNQATLNGYFSGSTFTNNYVWFQWGTDSSYGNTTSQQAFSNSGSFSQNISNLSYNTVYHFRAVAQGSGGIVYGQDVTFNSSGYSLGLINPGSLSISKKVINLTSGNLNWQTSVNAKSGDILTFAIIMQAGSQDIHNIVIKDILPAGLIYKGNMTIDASINYAGDPSTGINVGTIPANGISIVSFQVCVAPSTSFAYGSTTINNVATITSSEGGTQTANASVLVNNSLTYGATTVPTGLTNDPVKDSFFFPVFLIMFGSWLYFSGRIYIFADWLGEKIN